MFVDMRDKMSDMNAKAQENIAANRVVKAFAREEYEENRFDERSRAFRDANLDINKRWLSFYPFIEILANAMTLLTVFFGGYLMITDGMTAGELTIFTQLAWTLSVPMRQLGNLLNDWQRFITCSNKVMEIEVSRPEIVDSSCAVNHDHIEGAISFDHVSFAYGSQPVLSDVTFSAKPGQTVAIMGPTGSGKTTLIQLLARCYDVTSGSISVDGCNVRKWKLQQLRDGIGTATQDVFLFSGTIRSNIVLREENISDDEIMKVCRYVNADRFISKLDHGLEEEVRERGNNFSAGQRQLLSFARTIIHKPSVMILDEATANIDTETELLIQDSLEKMRTVGTMLIVAHRLSTIQHADNIIVLSHGKILEQGSHQELLAHHGRYYQLYTLQYHKEQLSS